jgi:hypothetical protein
MIVEAPDGDGNPLERTVVRFVILLLVVNGDPAAIARSFADGRLVESAARAGFDIRQFAAPGKMVGGGI